MTKFAVTKEVREHLANAVAQHDAGGPAKPFNVMFVDRMLAAPSEWSKSNVSYSRQMKKLLDAGLMVKVEKFAYLNRERIDEIRALIA